MRQPYASQRYEVRWTCIKTGRVDLRRFATLDAAKEFAERFRAKWPKTRYPHTSSPEQEFAVEIRDRRLDHPGVVWVMGEDEEEE